MASFLERLRSPRLFNFNLPDPDDSLVDQALGDRIFRSRAEASGSDFGGGGGNGFRPGVGGGVQPMRGGGGSGPGGPNYIYNPGISGAGGAHNVVYDQRPEQFAKEMKVRQAESEAKNRLAEVAMGIKQQQADTMADRADAYEFGVKNPLGRVVTPPGGNVTVVDPRTGKVVDTGVSSGRMTEADKINKTFQNAGAMEDKRQGGRVDLANLNNVSREGIAQRNNETSITNTNTRAADFTPQSASQQSESVRARARQMLNEHPEYANMLSFDDKGNPVINPGEAKADYMQGVVGVAGTDDALRRQLTQELYGPREVPMSERPGMGDSRGNPSMVDMLDPKGNPLRVPASEVAALEAKGARRKR